MMLASMPAINEKLLDYDAPFYGAFQIIHLDDLTVEQGRALLIKTAQRNGDAELVTFLESPTGLARLRVVEHLAGGSPRLWLIISGLMTVELLDELVPLFLKMLDELTPYYKARMDELAPAKAKILAVICRLGKDSPDLGPMSVKDIAAACSMSQQTVSKQLHELEKARFVRVVKNDKDRRASYYEPREPLLKHCLELKSNKGEPLSLIVSFLASWYSILELMNQVDQSPSALSALLQKLITVSNGDLLSEAEAGDFLPIFCLYLARNASTPQQMVLELKIRLDSYQQAKVCAVLFAISQTVDRIPAAELLQLLTSGSKDWQLAGAGASLLHSKAFPDTAKIDLSQDQIRELSIEVAMSADFNGYRKFCQQVTDLLTRALADIPESEDILRGQTREPKAHAHRPPTRSNDRAYGVPIDQFRQPSIMTYPNRRNTRKPTE